MPPLSPTSQLPNNPDVSPSVDTTLLSPEMTELLRSERIQTCRTHARSSRIPRSGLRLWHSVLTSPCSQSDPTTTISTSTTPVMMGSHSKASTASTLHTSWPSTGLRTTNGSGPTVEPTNCSSLSPMIALKIHLANPTLPKSLGQLPP